MPARCSLTISGVLVARGLGPEDRGYLALIVVVSGICVILGGCWPPDSSDLLRGARSCLCRSDSPLAHRAGHCSGCADLRRPARSSLRLRDARSAASQGGRTDLHPACPGDSQPDVRTRGPPCRDSASLRPFNAFRGAATALDVVVVLAIFPARRRRVDRPHGRLGRRPAHWRATRSRSRSPGTSACRRPWQSVTTVPGQVRLKSLVGAVSPVEALRLDQALVGLLPAPTSAWTLCRGPGLHEPSAGRCDEHRDDRLPPRRVAARCRRGPPCDVALLPVGRALRRIGHRLSRSRDRKLVELFFGSEFPEATPIARILLLATLFFMAARRVLTDGVNGLGRPGLGTLAEIASWVLLVPTIAILLPRYGVEGVALALAISWFASLLLSFGLVLVSGSRWFATGGPARLEIFPSLLFRAPRRLGSMNGHSLLVRGLALAAAVAAGVPIVAVAPAHASIGIIAALLAALIVALGRSVFARHADVLTRMKGGRRSFEPVESDSGEARRRRFPPRQSAVLRRDPSARDPQHFCVRRTGAVLRRLLPVQLSPGVRGHCHRAPRDSDLGSRPAAPWHRPLRAGRC